MVCLVSHLDNTARNKAFLLFGPIQTGPSAGSGTSRLRLDKEDRTIKEAIRRSKNRDRLSLTVCHAASIPDLQRALLEDDYRIVHISGHGTGNGLVLESPSGAMQVVPRDALSDLFAEFAQPRGILECVILNACYSISTGEFASLSVPWTIAMEGAISDDAAIEFARGFYDTIGAGKSLDAAYRQGDLARRMSFPTHAFKAHFLKRGQVVPTESKGPKPYESEPTRDQVEPTAHQLLLGFALDLSGSMRSSLDNDSQGTGTRLSSVQKSLQRLAEDTQAALRGIQERSEVEGAQVEAFVYGFGIRHQAIQAADLLTLLRLADDFISEEQIARLTDQHTRAVKREFERKAEQYSGLASLANSYGFGGAVRKAERLAKEGAESEIRRRVLTEIGTLIANQLKEAGDTTVNIGELAGLWEESGSSFSRLDELIYGFTPMRKAMADLQSRFSRELSSRNDVTPLLLLISDGDPTDGDPSRYFEILKEQGVTMVSCFVTSDDIADPRTLYGETQSYWPSGARLMFDAASQLDENSEIARFLLRKGWALNPGARLFVQINHSEVLDEFIRVLVAPFEQGRPGWQLPIGV